MNFFQIESWKLDYLKIQALQPQDKMHWALNVNIFPGHFGRVLAASMGHNIVNIGKKSQIRLSKEIKSQICKVSLNWDK